MTLSASSAPASFEDVETAVEALRAQGLRVTMARRLILQALFAAGDEPLAVEAIVRAANDDGGALDAASVYRNLEVFEQAGVARHVHLGHGPGLYALVGRGQREYLYCERCGRARAVAPGELDGVRNLIAKRFGHRASFAHFPIVGACEDCAPDAPTARSLQ